MADYPTPDIDPQETQEWLAALASVLDTEGPERAHFLLQQMVERARRHGAYLPQTWLPLRRGLTPAAFRTERACPLQQL